MTTTSSAPTGARRDWPGGTGSAAPTSPASEVSPPPDRCAARPGAGWRATPALALAAALAVVGLALPAAGFEASPSTSSDGVYQLSWASDGTVVVEESRDEAFRDARVLYRGTDLATTVTGRSDGVYFYRLRRVEGGDASAPVLRVVVAHHPLSRALAFFGLGAVVFGSTVVLVVRGSRDTAVERGGRDG